MGIAPGDKVRYRDRRAIVCTVHGDGAINVVFGTDYSEVSDGFWPPEAHERVDPDDVTPGWEDPVAAEDVEDDEPAVESEDASGDTVTVDDTSTASEDVDTATTADEPETVDEEDEPDPEDEWQFDFDPDAFVDRTPMSDVVDDIRTGEYDDVLDEIEAAEEAGRDRVGVAEAIEARR